MNSRVAILTYHSIDSSGSLISTSPNQFQRQMEVLKRRRYEVVPLRQVAQSIRNRIPLPRKSLAITFDDGYRNVYTTAYPVLREFGYSATVFLVADHMDRTNAWKGLPGSIPILDLLRWDDVLEMGQNGIEFGAHTLTHRDLSSLTPEEITGEVMFSKQRIETYLNRNLDLFAYPYGKLNRMVKEIVKTRFYAACSTRLAMAGWKSDPYALPRLEMYYFSKNNLFDRIGRPPFFVYLQFRRGLRTVRELLVKRRLSFLAVRATLAGRMTDRADLSEEK
jgi:peptidoglycan/xylan/chitin deacetylase (PgdA/CDA1 family)